MAGTGHIRRLTIFHYHLLPGGVTDVIVLSVRAVLRHMEEIEKITLVYGREENTEAVRRKILDRMPETAADKLSLVHLPAVDYREKQDRIFEPSSLLELMEDLFPGSDNLWMVHNYQLGKNPAFTQAMLMAAEKRDRPLLFQIHDFPECSRYANLAALKEGTDRPVYPQRVNTAYCVINARDRNLLTEAGMEKENIWLLNNPVPLGATAETDREAVKSALYRTYKNDFPALREKGKLLFYPVRSIRRKNILEAAFLVKMMEEDANFMVSLPGISPAEKPYSDLAEKAFREGLIPGLWGIGALPDTEVLNYPHYWAAADMVISPSIQEGFGYLYLNALHWRKPLFARYLDIMDGFINIFDKESSHFYENVPLPLSQDEKSRLKQLYKEKFVHLSSYMTPDSRDRLKKELDRIMGDGKICFSYLPPSMQYEALKKLDRDGAYREEAALMNRDNLSALNRLTAATVPDRDKEIEALFGERNYAATLRSIMDGLARGCRESHEESIQRGLEEKFLSLPYLRLLYGEGI